LKVLRRRTWEKIERRSSQGNDYGQSGDRIKGGLVVDIGVRAFLPGSHLTAANAEPGRSCRTKSGARHETETAAAERGGEPPRALEEELHARRGEPDGEDERRRWAR